MRIWLLLAGAALVLVGLGLPWFAGDSAWGDDHCRHGAIVVPDLAEGEAMRLTVRAAGWSWTPPGVRCEVSSPRGTSYVIESLW